MKKLTKGLISSLFGLLAVAPAFAQIPVGTIKASNDIGNITTLASAFIFAFNTMRYLGWAGVIVGVGMAIFALIYKLFATDNEEAMKTVQGYITKAVIIVLAGILLISAGFIVKVVASLIGADVSFDVDTEKVLDDSP